MSNYGLNTSYLQDLCQRILPSFSKVVSSDTISRAFPNFNKTRSAIVNTSEHIYPHGHWVSLKFIKPKNLFMFYDSYGFPPNLYPSIQEYLNQSGKRVRWFQRRIQSNSSLSCGYFCVGFLLALERGMRTSTYFKLFNKTGQDLNINDEIVCDFIKACVADSAS